ncbi:phospho-sugar mutase [Aestuariimicrobium sp. T2.26MG-19.2B]|uniref:phospho-sugar mutase n=1 Tax=Aestuariimicrobium sp. T2.26MG-19.2B TaxID=3040679 RepID=UPI0024779702|nr:phospho-sugar mutase [Aestuariimicrobium sp. T2.26MG-19.2B]CAI9407283.1 putative phosphomannomutase [Aestuariimicrobium sp. T2.26MG-19.2B]
MYDESPLDPNLRAAAEAWREQDPDAATAQALADLVDRAETGDQEALAELTDAFAGPLTFGTAGLRAALGPGPGRMNRVVVSQAAAGFAAWLRANGHQGGRVLIGYDARYNSDVFARDTAEIMAGAGFEAWVTDRSTPTPVVAFGIGEFDCVAAVVVTASHNPPADNGYKVYLGDGSQIVPPTDAEIADQIAAVAARPLHEIPRSEQYTLVGDELVSAYVARAGSLVAEGSPREVRWVYTPMHGVGARVVDRVVAAAGLPPGLAVAQQVDPDPAFPTVAFPNPEEPGAIDLAIALAKEQGADLVVANDPDADRCAVATVVDGQWRMLTGDELGALLGDDALRRGREGVYSCSVVSSTLLQRMAEAHGREFRSTLTGFKWIGRVPGLAFGYEEAIGYCTDPAKVPDKDGITALVNVLRLAAGLKAEGRTLADRLDEIACEYGLHTTGQLSVRVADLGIIADSMARLRANPPSHLLGEPVVVRDLSEPGGELPATDAIELTGERLHVVARPSGTEPKLKCYLEVRATPEETAADLAGTRERLVTELAGLRDEMAAALGL